MDKLDKMNKIISDKIIFELEQDKKKLVNRTALEKWIADGCLYEEDDEVLGILQFNWRFYIVSINWKYYLFGTVIFITLRVY